MCVLIAWIELCCSSGNVTGSICLKKPPDSPSLHGNLIAYRCGEGNHTNHTFHGADVSKSVSETDYSFLFVGGIKE